jgi:hypothetical protein
MSKISDFKSRKSDLRELLAPIGALEPLSTPPAKLREGWMRRAASLANAPPHARQTPPALAKADDHENDHDCYDHNDAVKFHHDPASISQSVSSLRIEA